MKTFEENVISRLQLLEREVERLQVKESPNSADFVKLTGDQTIAGVKTFSSIPVLPATNPTTDNQAVRKAYVDRFIDGWMPDTDTWTYVSATSFKITGKDTRSRFPTGTKIKLKQASIKYFYVTAASYSTDTTITITGGSDYSLANATISSPYYSYAETPQGFPTHFNYAPTVSYAGGTTDPTSFSFSHSWFTVTGSLCAVCWEATLTRGSGDRTYVEITLPINYSMQSSGSMTITFNGTKICPNYLQAGPGPARVSIEVGGMYSDGYLFGQLNYLIA